MQRMNEDLGQHLRSGGVGRSLQVKAGIETERLGLSRVFTFTIWWLCSSLKKILRYSTVVHSTLGGPMVPINSKVNDWQFFIILPYKYVRIY